MLPVAVRHAIAVQIVHQEAPLRRQAQQGLRVIYVLPNKRVQRPAIHPFHFD